MVARYDNTNSEFIQVVLKNLIRSKSKLIRNLTKKHDHFHLKLTLN